MEQLLPDEISWIDEQSETDEPRGLDVRKAKIAFSDGSFLQIIASVKRPPLSEMEPSFIEYIDPETGQAGEDWDDGSTEAWGFSEMSAAFRMLHRLLVIVGQIPGKPKMGNINPT